MLVIGNDYENFDAEMNLWHNREIEIRLNSNINFEKSCVEYFY